jgi:hypothetical protein
LLVDEGAKASPSILAHWSQTRQNQDQKLKDYRAWPLAGVFAPFVIQPFEPMDDVNEMMMDPIRNGLFTLMCLKA